MDIVETIYNTLKRRRYNRDKPFLSEELKTRLENFVYNERPIDLVGFWGVGPKSKSNWADEKSCDFLHELNKEVAKVYPPAIKFTFVFATLHGTHNGIEQTVLESYTKDIEKIFDRYKFKFRYLNPLWKKYGISFEKIDALFEGKLDGWWDKIGNAKAIEKNAKNRNQRLEPKIAAQKYFIMRGLEKGMWEKEYPQAIFHAFSDTKLRDVLPNMPTLYFYARKGWSDTPWFVTKDKEAE